MVGLSHAQSSTKVSGPELKKRVYVMKLKSCGGESGSPVVAWRIKRVDPFMCFYDERCAVFLLVKLDDILSIAVSEAT